MPDHHELDDELATEAIQRALGGTSLAPVLGVLSTADLWVLADAASDLAEAARQERRDRKEATR